MLVQTKYSLQHTVGVKGNGNLILSIRIQINQQQKKPMISFLIKGKKRGVMILFLISTSWALVSLTTLYWIICVSSGAISCLLWGIVHTNIHMAFSIGPVVRLYICILFLLSILVSVAIK